MRKFFLFVPLIIGLALFFASVAQAQSVPSIPAIPQISFSIPAIPQVPAIQLPSGMSGDNIVSQDFALFQKLDIGARFGIAFKSHINVCPAAASGEASCNARVITDAKGSPAVQVLPSGYGPVQFLKAYKLTGIASTTPARPIIAIVDSNDDPNIASDLATYDSMFSLPQLPACSGAVSASNVACFKKVNQTGATNRLPSANAGWALEISLDVETAHAACQNCSILLVEATSASYANLMSAVNEAVVLGANVVSNSYGGSEFSGETSYDSAFNHPGVAFVASAGDSGYGVEYPAASRYVTAVGGTSLYLNSDGSYNSEVAWSGTGSGCSAFEAKEPWQADAGCVRRTVADVSADADPNTGAAVYDSVRYDGMKGWFQVGGTSLASPLIAAIYAQSGKISTTTQGNSLPYLNNPTVNLNDVISGTNGSCGGSYLCTAMLGYDGPTGLGSPRSTVAF